MGTIDEALRRIGRKELVSVIGARREPTRQEAALADPRQLYSVARVAELMEMSTDWVYDRINGGELALVELGSTRAKQRISVGSSSGSSRSARSEG